MLTPLALLFCLTAAPRELAIIIIGPDVGRGAEVSAALARVAPDDVIIPADDATAIVERYANTCTATDAACWTRAGIASAVGAIVLVGPADAIAVVDVSTARRRTKDIEVGDPIDAALEALLYPDRFGRIVTTTVPTTATVTVDGHAPGDGEVRAGEHEVAVTAVGFGAQRLLVTVAGGETRTVDVALVAEAVVLNTAPVASAFNPVPTIVMSAGAIALVGGIAGLVITDGLASSAIAAIRAERDESDQLDTAENIQRISGGVAAAGGVGVVVGLVLLLTAPMEAQP